MDGMGNRIDVPVAKSNLQVFTFGGAWGLPTTGPFGLKLEACLRILGVSYERAYENDNRKGPKRKSPWIEEGDVRMGDTELILEYIERTHGKKIDGDLSSTESAHAAVLRRMLEEHYHQIFEYELFVLDDGFAQLKKIFAQTIPAAMLPVVAPLIRRGFKKHLFERGIGRHTPDEVAAMGRADVDALADWLGDREWFVADRPTKADASAFGLLAVSIRSSLPTPTCTYARSKPNLVAFVDRSLSRFFPRAASAIATS
jgi:glutathione S-transferase